jgi:DNA polymerase III delta prime subunit
MLREVTHVAVIRITKKQIEEANKAREAALLKDHDFRLHEEQQERLSSEAIAAKEKDQS